MVNDNIQTAADPAYQEARGVLTRHGLASANVVADATDLIQALVDRGWLPSINQGRPDEGNVPVTAEYVRAWKGAQSLEYWAESIEVGLVLLLSEALAEDGEALSGETTRHDR